MKIVIAGSRSIKNISLLLEAMDRAVKTGFIKPDHSYEIISGGAVGVDTLAREYAQQFNYPIREFKPDYAQYGTAAPFRRNTAMAEYGDVLIAVWDGSSRGTQHMVGQMQKLNKPVFVFQIGVSNLN